MAIPNGEQAFEAFGRFYKIVRINHSSGADTTFLVDQSASAVAVIEPASGGPTASLGSADANFEKTVTLTGGAAGLTTVVIAHAGGTIASTKPSSRA